MSPVTKEPKREKSERCACGGIKTLCPLHSPYR